MLKNLTLLSSTIILFTSVALAGVLPYKTCSQDDVQCLKERETASIREQEEFLTRQRGKLDELMKAVDRQRTMQEQTQESQTIRVPSQQPHK